MRSFLPGSNRRAFVSANSFHCEPEIRPGQLTDGKRADDAGKDAVRVARSHVFDRQVGRDDGSPSAEDPLVQQGEELGCDERAAQFRAEIVDDEQVAPAQIIRGNTQNLA